MNEYAIIQQASHACTIAITSCSTSYGLKAGTHHFTDLWARDSLFATFGALAIGERKIARTTIESFLSHQKPNGHVPYIIQRSPTSIDKYFLGKPTYFKTPKPGFRSHLTCGIVPDGGLMTIIASSHYVRKTNDKSFLIFYYPRLKKAMQWYIQTYSGDLISEWFACEWADANLKIGKILYTNILYWKALEDIGTIAKKLNEDKDALHFSHLKDGIRQRIHQQFWNGEYFINWIDYKKHDYFASHPNMLAVLFGLTLQDQTRSILEYAKKHCWQGFTLEENHPQYPWYRIPLFHHLIGMGDYHNRGCLWLQPGILYAVNLYTNGYKKEATRVFSAISRQIAAYGDVFEVYEKSGKPVKRLLYQAEHDFAWSAGLYLWAYHILKKLL